MTLTLSSTLWLAASLRLLLLVWGILQDARGGDIGYTDIDYQGASAPKWLGDPYARATYRYTPLLAVVTAPNIAFASFGKAMFAAADLLIGSLLYDILLDSGLPSVQAVRWTWLWLLNPIVAVVSTRGNAEALVGLAVISSLRQLVRRRNVSSAFFLGVAIHLKLYPIIYGASVLAFLSPRDRRFALCRAQIVYASVVAGTLLSLSWFMYELWGQPFIEHSLLYHFKRTDHRHNFSPFYYPFYLLADQRARGLTQSWLPHSLSILAFVPQLSLCAMFGLLYARHDTPFAWFMQTFVFVTFNKVCTSQYFLWYLWLAPVAFTKLQMSRSRLIWLVAVWISTQALWLSQAYLLEMRGLSVHGKVWAASLLFFAANVHITVEFAKAYNEHRIRMKTE